MNKVITNPMIDLNKRRELCEGLYQLILQDKDIAEELIDEYVYLLDDNRVDELTDLCVNQGELICYVMFQIVEGLALFQV